MSEKKSPVLAAQTIARALTAAALDLPFENRGELAHAAHFVMEQAEALRFERERVTALQERYFSLGAATASLEFDREGALALAQEILSNMLEIPDRSSPEEDPQALIASPEEITDCVLIALENRYERHTGRSVLGGRSHQSVCDARADTGACQHHGEPGYGPNRCPPYA